MICHLKSKDGTKERKYEPTYHSQLEENKTVAKYENGVAVKEANKTVKLAPKRSPEGTLSSDWKCPFYYAIYCNVTGHHDYRSVDFPMLGKLKEEKDGTAAFITQEAIKIAIGANASKGKPQY